VVGGPDGGGFGLGVFYVVGGEGEVVWGCFGVVVFGGFEVLWVVDFGD